MDAEGLLDRLIESGVVTTEEGELQLTGPFRESVDAATADFESAEDPADGIAGLVDDEGFIDRLSAVVEDDPEFVGYVCTLIEYLPEGVSSGELVRIAAVLEHIDGSFPPSEGSPEAFFPIHPTQIGTITALFPRSIVYIWRDDCDPCDVLREDFDDLFPEHPDDLALFSVYGPDDPAYLQEEYTVLGGPATLFFIWNRVDSRFYGAPLRVKTESEIEILRDTDPFDPALKPS